MVEYKPTTNEIWFNHYKLNDGDDSGKGPQILSSLNYKLLNNINPNIKIKLKFNKKSFIPIIGGGMNTRNRVVNTEQIGNITKISIPMTGGSMNTRNRVVNNEQIGNITKTSIIKDNEYSLFKPYILILIFSYFMIKY